MANETLDANDVLAGERARRDGVHSAALIGRMVWKFGCNEQDLRNREHGFREMMKGTGCRDTV